MQVSAIMAFIIKFDVASMPTNCHILLILWLAGIIFTGIFMFVQYDKFIFNVSLPIFLLMCFSYVLIPYVEGEIKGYKNLTNAINSIDPVKKYEVIVYQSFIPSISFYRNKIAIMAFSKERETLFEKDDNYKRYYKTDVLELSTLFKEEKNFFIVSSPKSIESLQATYKIKCSYISRQKKHSAYFCEQT
jgi:4-amino-4-deoxy-L-arabinose transferase